MPRVHRYAFVRRRRARRARAESRLGTAAALLLAVPLALVGALGSLVSTSVSRLVGDLPPVAQIEAQFGLRGAEAFRPPVVYDRSNQTPLFEVLHPRARQRRWVEAGTGELPQYLEAAMLAALDPTFMTNAGYELAGLVSLAQPSTTSRTLTQRLVDSSLVPAPQPTSGPAAHALQSALLAAQLTRSYSKQQILTWYLNSAYFGVWAYGVDGAALTYFGKHAAELSLAESAALAAAALDPEHNPVEAPAQARAAQRQVLQRMTGLGSITPEQERLALAAELAIDRQAVLQAWERPAYAEYLLGSLDRWLGEGRHRGGLRVVTTLDLDLQLQATCAAESQLQRLSLEGAGSVAAAADGSACVAAGLLPPLRPGDAEIDHAIESWALLVMDPTSGEVLAAQGPIDLPKPAGPMLIPFIHLTALSRGLPAGSMLLDLPPATAGLAERLGLALPASLAEYHGPMLMRQAVAELAPGAAVWSAQAVGEQHVQRTLEQLGLRWPSVDLAEAAEAGAQHSLIDLARAYGIVADQGRMQGAAWAAQGEDLSIEPVMVLRVDDGQGRNLLNPPRQAQHVLSTQLAFLMADMLSDESPRTAVLQVGRPAGAVLAASREGQVQWALGFTPQRVVGVWVGGASMQELSPQSGSGSIWHSVMRYAVSGLEPLGWERPPGVEQVEVCSPSGLLPTPYCARTVREFFVQGTEPSQYDALYQPYRINAETGKLATLFTPLDQVQERVYLVLPPEAWAWAELSGIEQPPREYDPLTPPAEADAQVRLSAPGAFDVLGGRVTIRGTAAPDNLQYYRLQFGEGLNPSRWVQVGSDEPRRQPGGVLGVWETAGLNGLYTLQLIAVLEDGQIRTAAIPITVDNQPPVAELLSPAAGESLRRGSLALQAAAQDAVGVERVEFYANGRRVAAATRAPFTATWTPPPGVTELDLLVRAYDLAGNWAESDPVSVVLTP